MPAGGRDIGRLPAEDFAGQLEVPKRSLTDILHALIAGEVEYVFGDSIAVRPPNNNGRSVPHSP